MTREQIRTLNTAHQLNALPTSVLGLARPPPLSAQPFPVAYTLIIKSIYSGRLYSADVSQGEDGPGLCSIISDHVKTMISCMRGSITTSMLLDVRGKFNVR